MTKELKNLKQEIMSLTKEKWFEIYFILQNRGEKYTLNKNGLYMDLSEFKPETIELIRTIIEESKNPKRSD